MSHQLRDLKIVDCHTKDLNLQQIRANPQEMELTTRILQLEHASRIAQNIKFNI